MNEQARLLDLIDYNIMDSMPERELDEIAEIALSICDTPISLLTFIDADRQWFKAAKGIGITEIQRKHSFCQYALNNSEEVLVIENPSEDERFKNNPWVLGETQVSFYAGAPLKTPNGTVLGTLCVIDSNPNKITEKQKIALMLLANKAMEYLNNRKRIFDQEKKIELDTERLKKLADLAPGIIFQFEIDAKGKNFFSFISKGISHVHPSLKPENIMAKPEIAIQVLHPDDVKRVQRSIQQSFLGRSNWNIEFRVFSIKGKLRWYWGNAKIERRKDGTVVWYGTLQNITSKMEYEQILEQILFDISHILRRPITTMLGITSLIEEETLNEQMLRHYAKNLKIVSEELNTFTKKLNIVYSKKMQSSLLKK